MQSKIEDRVYITHVKQIYWAEGCDKSPDLISKIAHSQFMVAKSILEHSDHIVLQESVVLDYNPQYKEAIPKTILKAHQIFPTGFPDDYNDLNEKQKKYLAKKGGAITLFYLGLLSNIYKTIEYEKYKKYDTKFEPREREAIFWAREAARKTNNPNALIVFGYGHDFEKRIELINDNSILYKKTINTSSNTYDKHREEAIRTLYYSSNLNNKGAQSINSFDQYYQSANELEENKELFETLKKGNLTDFSKLLEEAIKKGRDITQITNKYNTNILSSLSSSLFKTPEYNEYILARTSWQLSAINLKIAYLFEKKIVNSNTYANNNFLSLLIEIIDELINESPDLDKVISVAKSEIWPHAKLSILAIAIRAVTQSISEINDEQVQLHLLQLIEKIYLKAPYITIYLNIPKTIWNLALEKGNAALIKAIYPHLNESTKHAIFKSAFSLVNLEVINNVIDFERSINQSSHQKWLKKMCAWPLLNNQLSHSESRKPTKKMFAFFEIKPLIDALINDFPTNEDSTVFNLFFPFSNESGYKSLLKKLSIIANLRLSQVVQITETNKVKVGLLFGESNFLSMLPELAKYVDLVLLADIEPRQFKHIKHMLDCFNRAKTPDEFIKFYLTDNPIIDELIGEERIANIDYLTQRIRQAGSVSKFYYLSSTKQFSICKEAASKLTFAQIKLDLTNAEQCALLAGQLEKHEATIRFCNFTNIHDYIEDLSKLSRSVTQLLHFSQDYLIMYSEGLHPKTNISLGLGTYFSSCLKQPYSILETRTASQTDEETTNESSRIFLSKDPLQGSGLFSPTMSKTYKQIDPVRDLKINSLPGLR